MEDGLIPWIGIAMPKVCNLSIISCLALLSLLIGCQEDLSPIPNINTPKKFPSQTMQYLPKSNLTSQAWWHEIRDPELNRLVDLALKNNLDLHIAINNLERAQGQLKEVQLSWLPVLDLLAGYSTNPVFASPGTFYSGLPLYTINIVKQIKQQQLEQYNIDYYQAMLDGVKLSVIGQVTLAYLTLIAEQEQLCLLNNLDYDAKHLIKIRQQDIQVGLKNMIDIPDLLSAEKKIVAQIALVKHNIVASQNALHYLLNENPGKILSIQHFATLEFTKFKPGSLPASVLRNRPDIIMAAAAAEKAGASVDIAYSYFFPVLKLDQFMGQISSPKNMFAQFTDAYGNWELAPSTLGRIETQQAEYLAKRNEYIKTVRKVLREVDTDFSLNKKITEYYLATKAAEKDYQEKYNLQEGLLRSGLVSYNFVLESKIELDNLKIVTNQSKLQLASSLVSLYQDLAAGYKYSQ
jgi:outer membrane protein, multidrug efflux system